MFHFSCTFYKTICDIVYLNYILQQTEYLYSIVIPSTVFLGVLWSGTFIDNYFAQYALEFNLAPYIFYSVVYSNLLYNIYYIFFFNSSEWIVGCIILINVGVSTIIKLFKISCNIYKHFKNFKNNFSNL